MLRNQTKCAQIGRWIVGPVVGSESGLAFIQSYAPNPALITHVSPKQKWKHAVAGSFRRIYSKPRISCLESSMQNVTGDGTVFLCSDQRTDLCGFYTATGEISEDGKPVYVSARIGGAMRVLYSVNGDRWMIGEVPNRTDGWAYVDTTAKVGCSIPSGDSWNVAINGAWGIDQSFKLICGKPSWLGSVFQKMLHSRRIKTLAANRSFLLTNNLSVPLLGIATSGYPPDDQRANIKGFVQSGCKLLSVNEANGNEDVVGDLFRYGGKLYNSPGRDAVFIGAKGTRDGFRATLDLFNDIMERLATSYIDSYLLEWPLCSTGVDQCKGIRSWRDSYKALEMLYAEGQILSIGMSNVNEDFLVDVIDYNIVGPHIIQNSLDILHPDMNVRELCAKNGIMYQGYYSSDRLKQRTEYSALESILEWVVIEDSNTDPDIREHSKRLQYFDAVLLNFHLNEADSDKPGILRTGVVMLPCEWRDRALESMRVFSWRLPYDVRRILQDVWDRGSAILLWQQIQGGIQRGKSRDEIVTVLFKTVERNDVEDGTLWTPTKLDSNAVEDEEGSTIVAMVDSLVITLPVTLPNNQK
mmetsp:Transcript_29109/g.71012  ORF Transcript_29109/g.71012 Transcript_29109/m.71012 type:complete len:582 (-) Transcript_29109:135-1880(-)